MTIAGVKLVAQVIYTITLKSLSSKQPHHGNNITLLRLKPVIAVFVDCHHDADMRYLDKIMRLFASHPIEFKLDLSCFVIWSLRYDHLLLDGHRREIAPQWNIYELLFKILKSPLPCYIQFKIICIIWVSSVKYFVINYSHNWQGLS